MGRKFIAVFAAAFFMVTGLAYAESTTAEPAITNGSRTMPDLEALDRKIWVESEVSKPSVVSGPASMTFSEIFDQEVWPLIQTMFVREIPDTEAAKKDCLESIMQGGLSLCLEDPHSHYIPAREVKFNNERLTGHFAGVGLSLHMYNNSVTITEVLEDSSAEKSGKFRPGDVILEVNGESIAKMSLDRAVQKIRGLSGSTVTLRTSRLGIKRAPVTLKRAEIVVRSVKSEAIDHRTVLIKVYQFMPDTYDQFLKAVQSHTTLDKDGAIKKFDKNFVIDLRGNPGGLLKIVSRMGHLFAAGPDDMLVTIKSRTGEQSITAEQFLPMSQDKAMQLGLFRGMHFVVLVDHYSASASEIFAGMMKDFKLAKIVGTNTFGKGSVQQVIPLASGGEVAITFAEYLVGNSKTKVNGVGIAPDVTVNNVITIGDDEDAPQKVRSYKKAKIVDLKKDKQLRKALQVLYAEQK